MNTQLRSVSFPWRTTRWPLALTAAAALLVACGGNRPGPPPAPAAVPEVGVVEVRPQDVVIRTELPGRTTPFMVAEVRPQVGGLVKARPFREGSDVRAGQLGVVIGGTRWLFDLQQAGEIVAVGALTTVPLTQPWFLGLTNIRGNLISVVDFAHFQGNPPTTIDKQCRIIAFAPSLGFNGGLLVSRVLGLRNIDDMQAQAGDATDQGTADIEPGRQPGATGDRRVRPQRYTDRDRDVWQVLDLAAITRNPRFLQVGA